MTDIFTKEKRSEIMSGIRAKDTKTELAVRDKLEALGFEYHPIGVFGNPDFAHRRLRVAVFLDGCFWHGCPIHYRPPKTNPDFWAKKVSGNVRRDMKVGRELRRRGWLVIRIWEHDIPKGAEP